VTLDLRKLIAKSFGVLEEVENAICEQEERLRDMTAEVMAWRTAIDHYFGPFPMDEKADELLIEARRLRAQNEELYP
jgi:hypothetical protein